MKIEDFRGRRPEDPARELTEEDLLLGKKTVRVIEIMCLAAIAVCAGIAVFVFASVPLDTKLPYNGQFGRNGIPMPIAMLAVFLVLTGLWRATKKPDAYHLSKGARVRVPILGAVLILAFVGAQWAMAHAILVEGGALPA